MTASFVPLVSAAPAAASPVYVAVVHTVERVRFATAAVSRAALFERLAGYVRERVDDELREDGARRVRDLLAEDELEEAVLHYFARVGERWDAEWLVTAVVDAAAPRGVDAVLSRGVEAMLGGGSARAQPRLRACGA